MSTPPKIQRVIDFTRHNDLRKQKTSQARTERNIHNHTIKRINRYGIPVPSTNWINYTPNIGETTILIDPSTGTNYMHNAMQKRNEAVRKYKGLRRNASAKAKANANKTGGRRKTRHTRKTHRHRV